MTKMVSIFQVPLAELTEIKSTWFQNFEGKIFHQ